MVWVGGLVAVAVATAAARASLGEREQVEFFRALGRRYGVVSGAALAAFALTGLILLGDPGRWSPRESTTAGLVLLIACSTAAGVRAARRTQQAAAQALVDPNAAAQAQLTTARRRSVGLRALIATATLAAVLVATL